jgi:hypothetical protein
MKKHKLMQTPCVNKAVCLRDLEWEILCLNFEDTPDYQKIEDLLFDAIEIEGVPLDPAVVLPQELQTNPSKHFK